MRVAVALQLAAVLIAYGSGFITNRLWSSIGRLSIIAAGVMDLVNRVVAVQVLQEWGITQKKNTQLLASELTAAHARNAIFGGIHFWLNGCQTTAVQTNTAQLRPLAFVLAMV